MFAALIMDDAGGIYFMRIFPTDACRRRVPLKSLFLRRISYDLLAKQAQLFFAIQAGIIAAAMQQQMSE